MNGNMRWAAAGVLLALGAAFIGTYSFFTGQFASKSEVGIIRDEQQRRSSAVYSAAYHREEMTRTMDELARRIDRLAQDVRELEYAVADLGRRQDAMRSERPREERAPPRPPRSVPAPRSDARPAPGRDLPASGFPASGQP